MKYLIIPDDGSSRNLPFYFAVEEYVARNFNDDEYFFIWQVPPTVMLGRNQLADNETDFEFCRRNNIRIFRRKSGGGCVYSDGGCLQFSYIISSSDVGKVFAERMQTTVDILQTAGVGASLSGRNDIMIGDKKVAGAAFYRTGQRSVMHNTLLYHTDLSMLSAAVTPSKEKLISKGIDSVSQRVGNVGDYTDMSIADFTALARKKLCGTDCKTLTDYDMKEIAEIEKSLASDEFVYGNNPRYTLVRHRRIDGVGQMEAFIEVKNDIIRGINIVGDYFLLGDIDRDLLDILRGVKFNWALVEKTIESIDVSKIVRGLTNEQFLKLLFGRRPHVRKPEWLRIKLLTNSKFNDTSSVINDERLHTICRSGLCPNMAECWSRGTATFMIGGNVCTRACRFCNTLTGRPLALDIDEPGRVAQSVKKLQLKYAVITSVDRDDLPDMGAAHWANTIKAVRKLNPTVGIEVLIPDFQGNMPLIDKVLDAAPDVVGHNIETVERLTPSVRSVARYKQSIEVLRYISHRGFVCKTGFMVGLGETDEEVIDTMKEIAATGCSRLTIGQYLQPTAKHLPVVEYIHPEKFSEYKALAIEIGFSHVESGPLVRSSYHADTIT